MTEQIVQAEALPFEQTNEPEPLFENVFTSTARLGEFYKIFIVNLIFSVLTLGIFRFWAKTRNRRYVFSRVTLLGDAFEYHGTGGELFKGFLIVFFLFFLPFGIAPQIYAQTVILESPEIAGYIGTAQAILFATLFPIAVFRSYKYMASRVSWRGIRFSLGGKTVKYALIWFGNMLLVYATFGLYFPVMETKTMRYIGKNLKFGHQSFDMDIKAKKIYPPFLLTFLCVVGIAICAGLVFGQIGLAFQGEEALDKIEAHIFYFFAAMIAGYVVFGLLVLAAFAQYRVAVWNHFISNSSLGGARGYADVSATRYFFFSAINLILMGITFGFAFPIVASRYLKFISENVQISNAVSLEQTVQVSREEQKYGEGLADALDIGGF